MFLVYVPVLSVGLYFFATNCLPSPARRVLSRVVSEAVVAVAFAVARTARYAAALRSAYIWEKRKSLPTPLVKVLDALLKLDAGQVRVDTSSGHDSIQVVQAVLAVNDGPDYDLAAVLGDMWALGNGLRIVIPVNIALERLGVKDLDHDAFVAIRIRYRGHSNSKKRYPSETYSARYACELSQVFRFPPYPSSDSVRRGFGVRRIIRSNFADEDNGKMLYGLESKESAGLRRDFYNGVDDDPCLEKSVVTFFDTGARFQEKKRIIVTTANSKSKILCNSSQIPS